MASRESAMAPADEARRLAQRRRDRRITRQQMRIVRARRNEAKELEGAIKPHEKQAKDLREYIEARRKIFQAQKEAPVPSKYEHPSVHGYCLRPLRSAWDARKSSPIFFGYSPHRIVEDTVVPLDIKVFGIPGPQWTESLSAIFLSCVREYVGKLGVHADAVALARVETVRGENLRRVKEKVERRAAQSESFKEHQRNLLREDGGAVNVRILVNPPATDTIFKARDRFVLPPRASPASNDNFLQPTLRLAFDIEARERERAERLAKQLSRFVNGGGFLRSVVQRAPGQDGRISVAFNLTPRPHAGRKREDYGIQNDTPRNRQGKARRFAFAMSHTLERLGKPIAGMLNEPDYERSRFEHPAHIGRVSKHTRPKAEHVSPIFWGNWLTPQVPEPPLQNVLESHPAYFSEQDWVDRDYILHRDPLDAARHAETVPTQISPIFFGRYGCEPDHNTILARPREKTEQEEAEEDEAFLKNIQRRNRVSALERAEAEEEKKRQETMRRAIIRNRHPATLGYKTRTVPLFHDALRRVHPACLGYDCSDDEALRQPPRAVTQIVHPACIGFELAPQVLGEVRDAAKVVNPMFFGLTLDKGMRYKPPKPTNTALEKRIARMANLLRDPFVEGALKRRCTLCFGSGLEGCPMCWRPDAWQVDGLEDKAKDVVKAVRDNPNLRGRRRPETKRLTPTPKAPRTSVKLKLRGAAIEALRANMTLASPAAIRAYRREKATIMTIYIKTLPTGEVVRISLDSSQSIRYLYFLFRSNARREVSTMPRMWLVLPLMTGLVCLDETMLLENDLQCSFQPGALTLRDFGLDTNKSELCMFHVSDLYHPEVTKVVHAYLEQNVNMARKIDFLSLEAKERETPSFAIRKLRRYMASMGTGLSIKARVNEMRRKMARGELEVLDDGEGEAADASEAPHGFAGLSRQILREVRLQLLFRPDQVSRSTKPEEDKLQVVLCREMRDLLGRQAANWQEEIERREVLVEAARRRDIEKTIEARLKASPSRHHKAAIDDQKLERRARWNKRRQGEDKPPASSASLPTLPRLELSGAAGP